MFNNVRELLFNLFIVFLPVIIYPYIMKTDRENGYNRVIIATVFSITLVATMTFPVVLNGLTFDLRAVALSIGSFLPMRIIKMYRSSNKSSKMSFLFSVIKINCGKR